MRPSLQAVTTHRHSGLMRWHVYANFACVSHFRCRLYWTQCAEWNRSHHGLRFTLIVFAKICTINGFHISAPVILTFNLVA